MSTSDNTPANDTTAAPGRYPHPFDTPELGYIVTLAGHDGLHEALQLEPDGRWAFRALNTYGEPLTYARPEEMTVFSLPIYHSFASRDRSEIVAMVSGVDFDVTYDEPEVALPLFQKVHGADLISFCLLALDAGFSNIELSNGYVPWEGTIEELIEECRELAAAT